jgi:hypothetical protein
MAHAALGRVPMITMQRNLLSPTSGIGLLGLTGIIGGHRYAYESHESYVQFDS